MLRLEDLIGKIVVLSVQNSDKAGGFDAKIHGVETGGLWVEIGEMEKAIGYVPRKNTRFLPQRKPVFFIPYAQIAFLIADSTELDESGLGV